MQIFNDNSQSTGETIRSQQNGLIDLSNFSHNHPSNSNEELRKPKIFSKYNKFVTKTREKHLFLVAVYN